MIVALIVVSSVMTYLIAGGATGRWFYGMRRARMIDRYAAERAQEMHNRRTKRYYAQDHNAGKDPVKRWDEKNREDLTAGSVIVAILWPVSLPILVGTGLSQRLAGGPRLSNYELEVQQAELEKKITDLEKQLGLAQP